MRKGDIKFYKNQQKLKHVDGHINMVKKVSLTFMTQKMVPRDSR